MEAHVLCLHVQNVHESTKTCVSTYFLHLDQLYPHHIGKRSIVVRLDECVAINKHIP